MSDRLSRTSPAPRRWLVLLTVVALLTTLLGVLPAPVTAEAAEVLALNHTFKQNAISGTGTFTTPTTPGGSNQACLTASGNSSTGPLLSCSGTTDASGSGALRLTPAAGSQIGAVFGSAAVSTANGLEFSFNSYQYGGSGADGIGFALTAADPSSLAPPTTTGPGGGQLGYSPGSTSGVANGYLGVGLDVYGSYSNTTSSGSGCTNPTNISSTVPGAIVVRGPGTGTTGYCPLTTTYDGTSSSQLTLRSTTRAASVVPVHVFVNPMTTPFTSADGATVAPGTYQVIATPVGGSPKTLTGTLPVAPSTLYPATTWVNANGVPKQLAFGFLGSTGGQNDIHEITDLQVRTFAPDPTLNVSATSYSAATSAAGDPVTYVAQTTVSSAPVTGPVTVKLTTPTGVLPLAGYADGYTCGTPSGQTISCSTSGAYVFAVGSSSPNITFVAIATTSVPASTIQSSSSVTASASGAITGTDSTMTAGTRPTAPSGVAVSPSTGTTAGGTTVTVTGSNITAATAVEIGTSTEMTAGTPATLLTCASGVTTRCFKVSGSSLLVYTPAHAQATASVKVVTLGIAASASYVYAGSPSTMAAPTVTAGVTSAAVSWTAATANGAAITGYTVTPYQGSTAQTAISVAAGSTSLTAAGLTAGSSYTFTVAATNAIGTSSASPKSTAVVPYDVPGAPTIGSVVAADLAVTLSWTAPSANGSAITGYVVTPYIGTTAQTTQTFASTATSQSITGLTAGTAYTFTVAAKNAAGTGPASAASSSATPNPQPSLSFAAPPSGAVGVSYSTQLAATGGTSPFTWSVSSGTLPAGLTLGSSSGLLSGTPTTAGSSTFTIKVVDANNQSATQALTLIVIGPPSTPAKPTATAGLGQVTLSWVAPNNNGATLTGYVITPSLGGTAQTAINVDPAATTRVISGLTVGGSYTFTVAAVNSQGTSPASAASTAVVPYAALSAPTITSVSAGDLSAVLTWSAPTSTGGSAITGYVVTPYIGSVAQTPQVFTGTGTTKTVTGLTAGTAYTFQVAAQNASGATSTYRVNAGGPLVTATDGGPNWSLDNNSTSNAYHDTNSSIGTFSPSVTFDSTVPTGTPTTLFDDERYDPGAKGDGSEMLWQFPVTSGASVKVRLYFAERTFSDPTTRTFDVSIDGSSVLNNFSPNAGAGGAQIATMREFGITSDGSVDIGFTHEVENPNVSAIEIIQTGQSITGPASAASSAVTPNASPTLTFASPPVATLGVAYSDQLAVTGGTVPFTWSVSSGTLPAGLTLDASSGLLSGTPTALGSSTVTIKVVDASNQNATKTVTLVVASAPSTPAQPTATAGLQQVTLSWVAPSSNQATITGYVITPSLGGTAQTAITVDPAATTRVFSGLTAGGSYTFTIAAVNSQGTSAASPASAAVVPYAALSAPTITAVQAGDSSAVLTWTAPTSTGGSAITGYVVTPYIGSVAQTPQTFASTATTQTVTGLTPGTAYTFRVAAQNTSGTPSLYRIDAGGPQVAATDGGLSWAADSGSGSPYHGNINTAQYSPSAALDSTIPPGTPPALFDTEAYGNTMAWQFPVTSGASVKVRLYFANRYTGTGSVGKRVFDVSLDGAKVLNSFDIISGAGADQTATMREFSLISDGTLDIGFTARADNALISAIDIIQTGQPATGPASAASAAVTANASPTLNFPAPPAGEVGVAYSNQLAVTGGTSPFTWSIASGSLPAGLSLNASTGLLSGTPTTAGSYSFTVQVVDGSGQSASQAVTLVVAAAPTLAFAPAAGEVSVAYSQQPTVTGGTAPYTWRVSAGSLPGGLTLDASSGLVSGTPTASGTFNVTVAVTDAFSVTVTKTVSIVIMALPTLTFSAPAAGQVAVAYSTTFTASGGTTPLVWSISAGSLPSGLTLNTSTGVLSGTPTTVGSSSFTVAVKDANNQTTSKAATLVIATGPLVIAKTADASSTVVGNKVTFTTTVTNTGPAAFTGVALSDPLDSPGSVLDDAAYNNDATASTGTVSYASGTVSWSGDVAVNATVTITYSVTVSNPDPGNHVLVSTVVSSTSGTNCASGSTDARCRASVAVAGLSIVKTADAATTTPGSVVRFTIVVQNTGGAAVTGATLTDQLGGVLDDATYNADATATAGQATFSSPQLTWTGNLAVGASVTIRYSVTVANPDTGNKSLGATVVSATAGSSCPSGTPAASCTTTVQVLIPALAITNAVTTPAGGSTTIPGAAVTFTQTLSNNGQTAYTGISVTLALNGALDDATYTSSTASAGSLVVDPSAKTAVWTGDLALGAAVTVTETFTALNPAVGDRSIATTASSSAPGSTCPAGSSNAACTAAVQVLVPALTIAQTTDVSSTTPGSTVHYTVTVSNTGQTPYTGATFTESLSRVLDDATYKADVSASSGAVSYSVPTLSWTGDLAVGATATITYSVTVGSPDPGDLSLVSTVVSSTPFSTCPAGGTNSRCTSTVAVLIPGLTISTSADPASTVPGGVVRYLVSVQNTGQTTYTGASVTLNVAGVLDDATYNNDQSVSTGSLVVKTGGSSSWVLTLAPGQSATATSSFTVLDPTPASGADKTLVSTVASDVAGSTCPTGSTAAACRTSVPVLTPRLTITKTASSSAAVTGDTVGYTVLVVNSGETSYSAASFTDDLASVLDDATYSSDATATTGTVSYAGSVLTWTGSLAPGATATVSYSVVVRDPDPGDKRMTDTVVSTAVRNNCPAGSTDASCTAVVNVLVPGLTIAKTASAATTVPGAVVGYTIRVTNSGDTAYTGATLSDPLAAVLDDATYNGDATATSGTVTQSGGTLSWTGNLAVGATATITYAVTVKTAISGDNLLTNTVTSATRGTNCAAGSTDPRCTVVVPVARLVLERVPGPPATTTPGSVLNLSVRYTNAGQVAYSGISVDIPRADTSDDLFATTTDVASAGTLSQTSTTTRWTGDIPVGGAVTITIMRTVRDPDTGNKIITAPMQSDAPGSSCPTTGATDPRCTFTTLVLVPALSITKSVSSTSVEPGGQVVYTISVQNSGQTAYSAATGTAAVFTDALDGVLDDAGYDNDATATVGTVGYSSPTLSWTGDLGVGASAVISYSVTVTSPATGDKSMSNTVASTSKGSTCPPASSSTSCRATTGVLTPGLTLVKTANVANATLGTTVTFTVSATNTGQTNYSAANLTDSLADVLDTATYNPGATTGNPAYSDGTLSWTGPLNVGASKTITYTVTINDPATGDLDLDNRVVSSTPGNNCLAASADPRCRATVAVTNSVALTLTKTANVLSTVDGGKVVFTVTATNASAAALGSVNFSDPLFGVLDDATYDNDATIDSGAVAYADATLTWTGTVPAGGMVTLTYSVTVAKPASGDLLLTSKISSTSPAESNSCLANSPDPRCTVTVPVARLTIIQQSSPTSATPGSLVNLSATYTNTGQLPYSGISVTVPRGDSADDLEPIRPDTADSGTLVRTDDAVVWRGDIAVGQTVTLDVIRRVKNPPTGNRVATATLVSDAPGSNCGAGTTDPRCTYRVLVVVPGLTITKAASSASVDSGGVVGYTITVTNSGQTAYSAATSTAAVVTDSLVGVLDDASYDADATATSGTVGYDNQTLAWTGDLAVGASAVVSYSVTAASPAAGDKTMTNTVSSTSTGSSCLPSSNSAGCRATTTVLTPQLTITSSASKVSAVPGDVVSYTVTATNSGQSDYTNADVTASLAGLTDDATYAGGAGATTGSVVLDGSNLVWNGTLVVGASVTITYSVTVKSLAQDTGDHRLAQTLTSLTHGSDCAPGSTDGRCRTDVPIAGLRIVNAVDATTTAPSGVVRHTGTFTNTGQVPYVGITISDSFVGTLDNATYNGDAAASSGSVIIVVGSGRVSWTGDVAVGQTVTVTASLTVNNPASGDDHLTTLITSDAAANNCVSGSSDPACATSVTLLRPQLSITKTVSSPTTTPGATLGYTITARNTGQTDYAGATIRDDLTTALTSARLGTVQATRGATSTSNQVLSWVGDLAVGQQVVITYPLTVNDPDVGGGSIGNTVTSDEIGSSCPTGSSAPACTTLVTVLHPALGVSVTADQTSTTPGSPVGYTIVVRNTGETDYASTSVTADLSGVVDDATYSGDATVTGGGAVTYAEGALTWTGALAKGASATIAYHVTVTDPDLGNRLLVTSVSSPAAGTTCSAGSPCTSTVQVLLPGLAVSSTADVATATPGQAVTFTLRIRNTGQTAYVGTSVSTDLASVVDDATFNDLISSSRGTTSYSGTLLTWTGSLAVGDQALVTYTVVVRPASALSQEKVLRSTVLADVPGSTCRTGDQNASCTASVSVLVPALTITKSANRTTATPGDRVDYTIKITNSGQTTYSGAVVSDSLADLLSEAAYGADATVTGGGVVIYADSILTWTGDLLVGATATITYSLTVNNPYVGDRSLSNSVVSSAPGSSCPTGDSQTGCTSVVQVLVPALGVNQTASRTSVVAGDAVVYTVTLTNTGETDYQPATFRDSFAAPGILAFADYANDARATVGSVSYTNQTLVWTGPLLKGQSAVVTFSVVTRYPAPAPVGGLRSMANTVTSATAGSTCVTGTRARCRTSVSVLQPALSIIKTADTSLVVAGGTVGYTISATNTGEADYPVAALSDDLGALLPYGVYAGDATASTGAVSRSGDTLSWSGPLARGGTVLITFSVRVDVGTPDVTVLANRVVSTTTGSTCGVGSVDPGCVASTAIAPRTLTLDGLTQSFTLTGLPGSTVEKDGAAGLTVTTNSAGGYAITVGSTTDVLKGSGSNTDTIPIGQLSVRRSDTGDFTPMSRTPLTVHTATGPTSTGGDAISNDYQVEIPDVASGTYSTELEYIATAQ